MVVMIEDVVVHVPHRYPTYKPEQKKAIASRVRELKKRCGDRLISVHVSRVVKGKATHGQPRWRVDGGWSMK